MTTQQLTQQIHLKKTFLCIGLDVDLTKIPPHLLQVEDPIFEFNKAIIDATHDLCVSYKPNTAFYEAYGLKGWQSLEKTIKYINEKYPGQMLAYNCSPSFNWAKFMDEKTMLTFREELAAMGYKFQFITLAGFHALNTSMFELSKAYVERGMAGFSQLQQREFALEKDGFKAVKHQSFVGTGYFDAVQNVVQQGNSSTTALAGSTEAEQFH